MSTDLKKHPMCKLILSTCKAIKRTIITIYHKTFAPKPKSLYIPPIPIGTRGSCNWGAMEDYVDKITSGGFYVSSADKPGRYHACSPEGWPFCHHPYGIIEKTNVMGDWITDTRGNRILKIKEGPIGILILSKLEEQRCQS